jgi:hypothetical protein
VRLHVQLEVAAITPRCAVAAPEDGADATDAEFARYLEGASLERRPARLKRDRGKSLGIEEVGAAKVGVALLVTRGDGGDVD